MKDTDAVVQALKNTENELQRFGVVVYRGRSLDLQKVRQALSKAVELIEEQDITIRAMMGEFGDACDDNCGEG